MLLNIFGLLLVNFGLPLGIIRQIWKSLKIIIEQAGTELGQAQLKLGLGFTSTINSQ